MGRWISTAGSRPILAGGGTPLMRAITCRDQHAADSRILVPKNDVAMNEIANRLHAILQAASPPRTAWWWLALTTGLHRSGPFRLVSMTALPCCAGCASK